MPVEAVKKKDKGTVIKEAGPVTLFPKSPASASLVSFLMDMKYSKEVPIYRIEQSMKQEGILFPRHTYARWMIDSSDRYLEKVYTYMHKDYWRRISFMRMRHITMYLQMAEKAVSIDCYIICS